MDSGEKTLVDVTVSKDDIKVGLRKLGLGKGDNMGVRSSLSSFGRVEGGADAVIDALLDVVGEEGTIVMPTYSTNLTKVERTPEEMARAIWCCVSAEMLKYQCYKLHDTNYASQQGGSKHG